ncbi:MAG TPA: hypothetical protein VL688_05630 [Verrucomicrobiae bacterium]|jgi:hypothetical protein|nr:hypothetical protein [Verrucomicrobiae bacterium]
MKHIGNFIGVLGIVVCIASVIGRFLHQAAVFEFQAINIYIVGTGLIACGCFAKLSGR